MSRTDISQKSSASVPRVTSESVVCSKRLCPRPGTPITSALRTARCPLRQAPGVACNGCNGCNGGRCHGRHGCHGGACHGSTRSASAWLPCLLPKHVLARASRRLSLPFWCPRRESGHRTFWALSTLPVGSGHAGCADRTWPAIAKRHDPLTHGICDRPLNMGEERRRRQQGGVHASPETGSATLRSAAHPRPNPKLPVLEVMIEFVATPDAEAVLSRWYCKLGQLGRERLRGDRS